MNILIAEINHETNTFSSKQTSLHDFKDRYFVSGECIKYQFEGTGSVLGGFLDVLSKKDATPVYAVAAAAAPGGIVCTRAFEHICQRLDEAMSQAVGIDGVLLSLHGAMVCEAYQSADFEIVRRIRHRLKKDIPLVVTLDLHGNIDPNLCGLVDGAIACKTYPHVDFFETGQDAATLILDLIRQKVRAKVSCMKRPIVFPLTSQRTDLAWYQQTRRLCLDLEKAIPEITDISILFGFYFSDTPHLGVSVLMTSIGENQTIEAQHKNLLEHIERQIQQLESSVLDISTLAQQLDRVGSKQVVIADVSDNPGAGADGKNIAILAEFLRRKVTKAVFAGLFYPEIVEQLRGNALGDIVDLQLKDTEKNTVACQAQLVARHNGTYTYTGEYDKGCAANYGEAALLDIAGCQIILHSVRHQCLDPGMLTSIGIQLEKITFFVVKSSVHFRAAFSPIADIILEVDSGAEIICNPAHLHYKKANIHQ